MNFQTLNKQRKFIVIAAAVGIISIFLPWYSFGAGGLFGGSGFGTTINGFRGIGIFVFILFLGSAGLALMGEQTLALDKNSWLISLGIAAVALLCIGIRLLNISNSDVLGLVKPGFGIWIALLASIAIIASVWLFKNPAHTLKDSFDSLKKDLPIQANSAGKTSRVDELEKLIELKAQGKISEEEYQDMKAKIM